MVGTGQQLLPSISCSFSETPLLVIAHGDNDSFPLGWSSLLSISPWAFNHMLPPMEFNIHGELPYFPIMFAVSLLSSTIADVEPDTPQMLLCLILTSMEEVGHCYPIFQIRKLQIREVK